MDRLRATFVAGPAVGFAAQEVFANRVSEIEAFRQSVARMREQHTEHERKSSDFRIGRRNALVYYGIGGIGKTALSKELENRLKDKSIADGLPKRCTASRIDFGESGDFDLEAILLRIRASLSEIRGSWPAFDLAFRLYWERNHPGESIPEFMQHSSTLRHYGRSLEFAEQMQETLLRVFEELGMVWAPSRLAVRLASITHEHLMRSVTYKRLTESCPFFQPIVTAEQNIDALSYMPSLLEWQLEGLRQEYFTAVFADTFEAVGGRDQRDAERYFQRIVFLMPSVLFIITGRNRIDWADRAPTEDLDYVGHTRWPLLDLKNQTTEPRQHLIGALSPEDCDFYLRTVLTNPDGTPTLSDSIRRKIVEGSDGLPLYLDLSVTQFMELQATGGSIDVDTFGGPLASIVARIMRNLDDEERNILRGASLLDSFDIDLAHAASGSSDAKIVRFVNSALITTTVELPWPYVLHEQLRRSIQETDKDLKDAWSRREWRAAAEKICDHLGRSYATAAKSRDRALAAACFTQAVRLVDLSEVVPRWVLDAAQFLADAGMWQSLDVRLSSVDEHTPAAVALSRGLRGISLRRSGSLDGSIGEFDAALSSSALEADAADLLRLHRAHSLRNSGRYDLAQEEYRRIADQAGTYANRARLQLADIYYLRGKFEEALRMLDGLGGEEDPDAVGEALRIRGHVYRANCQFNLAELEYLRALELGRQINSRALEGKALTNLAESLCWTKQAEAGTYASEAIEFNSNIGNQLEVLKAYVAKALCHHGRDAEDAVSMALELVEKSDYRAGAVFALSARAFHQILDSDTRVTDTANELRDIASKINVYYYWYEIVKWWLSSARMGKSVPELALGLRSDWLGHREQARRRWTAVLRERLRNDE